MNVKGKFLYLAGLIVLTIIFLQGHRSPTASQAFDSPLPTPYPGPTPTAVPRCHALAIAYVARERSISKEALIAGSYVSNENGKWTSDGKEEWFEFPLIGRRACFVKVNVKDSDTVYSVALDEQGQIVDLEELRALEREAGHSECGKFDPALCARIPTLTSNEQVEVAIWLEDIDVAAIYDAVAADYPASLQPGKGLPFDVNHPDYEKAFREVEDRMSGANKEREEPVVAFLATEGFKASYASTTAPVVFAELTGEALDALAAREDVVGIYLLDGEFEDAMNSIDPTIRVPQIWNEGYTGDGVKVAVVEDDPIDFNNQYLDHANGGTGPPALAWYPDNMSHPTKTAGVIAMKDQSLYQGTAPDVTLYSADAGSYNPQSNIADASDWAVNAPNSVDVLNCSFGDDATTHDFWARYFDHVAWNYNRIVVVATGNDGDAVASPATGYNVISVGAFDDNDNSDWSDDEISGFSNYQGPGNRDKPEVVAVGESVCTTDLTGDDVGCADIHGPYAGTSLAAPQVSGLAALLTEKFGYRRTELVKAIIMASAVHNIEGDSRLSDYDGAGGIDAALAYEIADHGHYGIADDGWYVYYPVFDGDFDDQDYLHHYVPVSRGEKVRVVLAYSSHPDETDPYDNDLLVSDLDLRVMDPSNSLVAASSSAVNNFEIVEFIAGKTGNYDIRVKRSSWDTTYEMIGLAWLRDATYLPDIKSGYNNWDSVIVARNDGATERDVKITFFNTDGSYANETATYYDLDPGAIWTYNSSRVNFNGSAIISGGEDVSVIAKTIETTSGRTTMYSGIATGGAADPVFEQVGSTLYAPAVYNQAWGWNSTVAIMNTGITTTVTVQFEGRDNYGSDSRQYILVPNEVESISVGSVWGSSRWLGSLIIQSDNGKSLAATLQETYSSGGGRSYNATAVGQTEMILPAMYKDKWGITSGLVVQNVGNTATDVTLTFRDRQGNFSDLETWWDLAAGKAQGLWLGSHGGLPANWTGWVKVSSAQPLAVYVNTKLSGNRYYAHTGAGQGGVTVILPWAARSAGGRTTGYTLVNPGWAGLNITARYYDSGGNEVGPARRQFALQVHQVVGYHQNGDTALPLGWQGSIVLEADGPIWAVMREDGGTTSSAYTGFAR